MAIRKYLRQDGGLACAFPLVSWVRGDRVVILDGEFTAQQLRAMAEHMERGGRVPKRPAVWPYLAPPA